MPGKIPINGLGYAPAHLFQEFVYAVDPDFYTTTQKFTYTKTSTPTQANGILPTPGTLLAPGRPAHSLAYSAGATEGECIQSTASFIPQIGVPFYAFVSVYATTGSSTGSPDFLVGLVTGASGTPCASDVADMAVFQKVQGAVSPIIKFRNASGTAETSVVPLVMKDATWYDFMIKIEKDAYQADGKKGSIEVFYAEGSVPNAQLISLGKWYTLAALPTSVVAATCSMRPYTTGKTVAMSYFGYALGTP